MTDVDRANAAFQQAAKEGGSKGRSLAPKPRNPLHAANQELLQEGSRRKRFTVCPNCNDQGCPYCGPANEALRRIEEG